jgi:hypothetical protein
VTLLFSSLLALTACDTQTATPGPAAAEDPCPNISLEGLPGQYLKWAGTADHTRRIEIRNDGGIWEGWFVDGGFTKKRMAGAQRADDVSFTEVLTAADEARFQSGSRDKTRLYFQPYKKKCTIRVIQAKVKMTDGKETEQQQGAGFQEYVALPEQYTFTFRPADETLFLGKAAADEKVAAAQVARSGTAEPATDLGEAIPVGLWTDAAADGADDCTYSMDLFFDDQPVEGKQDVAVSTVKDGRRQWYAEWFAPYSGNHIFEMYRYKTCGGSKDLIAVAAIEAILN